jgi:mitochondrial chaperone BCS1
MTDQQDDAGHMGMNMDGLQTMGIVNAMRTGDSRVDIVIAMLIPLVLRLIFDFAKRSEQIFTADFWIDLHKKWFEVNEDECERVLMYSTRTKDENKNTLLSKAVLLYVNQVLHIELTNANIYLTSPKEQGTHSNNYNYYYDDDEDDDDEKPETYADRLGKLQVLKMPIDNEWVDLGPSPVGGGEKAPSSSSSSWSSNTASVLMHYSRDEKEGANNVLVDVVTTLRFRSKSRLAIDNFIDRAYHYYVEEMKKTETNHRYFYELKTVGDNMDGDDDTYTRYRLSDEKTFDSLFFPEKETLLRLLQHFLDRSGKYAIKGYPHKLGLLLHGPPGTGT